MREISLAILDVAQNSIDAGATLVEITVTIDENLIGFAVADNGKGMSEVELSNAVERGVSFKGGSGLGLALLKEETCEAGGKLKISSEAGAGATVKAEYKAKSAVIGKLGDTFATLVDEGYDTVLNLSVLGKRYSYDTRELKSSAGVARLQSSGALRLIREDINKKTNGGAML
ncbi:MAG: ATP-binding protein [Bacteroides sp.]|nr:ATP-binding protein [Bacillota bacterium]MCM1394266.1 ATP-binding protein [[Eubacterium] siraeum]MCM1455790.1 ATP-binding protein [Bacteroides sp.]